MFCDKFKKEVLVEDCEDCLDKRRCDPICLARGFVWGVPDGQEPRWEYSYNEAKSLNIDVSKYYRPHEDAPEIDQNGYVKQSIPSEIRWTVWERDNFTCQVCEIRRNLTVDHIKPESKGGKLELSNLQTLCKSCNCRKNDRNISNDTLRKLLKKVPNKDAIYGPTDLV